jgi:hypothetical protein
MIRHAYQQGVRDACIKFALAPPTQVDQFVADVDQGKDVPPPSLSMDAPQPPPTALDGTTPLQMPQPEPTLGSTVGPPPQGV